jgi:hypothetical protein
MDSKQVLQILGLNDKRFGRLVRNKKFKVSREVQCLASEGAPKRLDLVIRFDDGAGVILVEVKVQDLDKAGGHENLVDYCRWLERQGDPNRRYAVLLVQAKPDQDCPGWDVRLWEDVSLNLRWLAMSRVKSRRSARGKSRRSASAVEQNVLGLDGSGDTLSAPPTKLYLERFLEGIRV